MAAAFNKRFLTREGAEGQGAFYGNNTATANLLPLAFGLVPDDCRAGVVGNLVKNIVEKNQCHVSCGVIGISWLLRVLSDNGRADVAWRLATTKTYPSWGYMAEHGATTIWELWNGDTANPAMNSGNHVMLLGDLLTWCYQYLAGVKPKRPTPQPLPVSEGSGMPLQAANSQAERVSTPLPSRATGVFRAATNVAAAPPRGANSSFATEGGQGGGSFSLAPDFSIPDCFSVDARYESPYGPVVSQWQKDGSGHVSWQVAIPANTTATRRLADGKEQHIGSGAYVFESPATRRWKGAAHRVGGLCLRVVIARHHHARRHHGKEGVHRPTASRALLPCFHHCGTAERRLARSVVCRKIRRTSRCENLDLASPQGVAGVDQARYCRDGNLRGGTGETDYR